jgi:hypothetical protein
MLPPGGLPGAGALEGAVLGAADVGDSGSFGPGYDSPSNGVGGSAGLAANGTGHYGRDDAYITERSLAATAPTLNAIRDDRDLPLRPLVVEGPATLRDTLKPMNAIGMPLMKSGPTADTAAVPLPTMAYPNEPTIGRGETFQYHDGSTVRRAAWNGPVPRGRRILVSLAAAIAVVALALTVVLWPSRDPAPPAPAGRRPGAASSSSAAARPGATSAATRAAAGGNATGATANPSGAAGASAGAAAAASPTTPVEPGPSVGGSGSAAPAATPSYATLNINVDAPAVITVDGQAQPLGTVATVNVVPGVEHVVTVQRPGHSMRRLIVPALSPGEQMPLHFNVR